jgi:F-box protein 21
MNNFPHFFLGLNGQDSDDTAKRSIPISLVYVFCSIAYRLNLDAHPLNFPNRVIARVCVVPGQAGPEDVYVDIFLGKVMSRTDGVPALLQAAGIDDVNAEEALALVPVGELLMCATRNIFNWYDVICSYRT